MRAAGRGRDGHEKNRSKGIFSYSGKWKGWLRKKGGGRTRQWGFYVGVMRALRWAGAATGERSERCGHAQTTQALLYKLPFLKPGKEMLRFTVTTSRLYNVDVKLRARSRWITVPWVFFFLVFFWRAIPAQPPCLDTCFIYVLRNRADSAALTFFFLFILSKK